MYAAACPSDRALEVAAAAPRSAADALRPIRVAGGVDVTVERSERGSGVARLAEADGYRLRFPHRAGEVCDLVLVNTGGGVAGGDRVRIDVAIANRAAASLTTIGAERILRTETAPAEIDVRLRLDRSATMLWLPWETILFSGSCLTRRVEVDMADDASLLLADIVVLGRRASGERMTTGRLVDQWRIRRGSRLVHAEATRLEGAIDPRLQHAAVADGGHVLATLVWIAPDTEAVIDKVRTALEGGCRSGIAAAASTWEGKLVVRVVAHSTEGVRALIAHVAAIVSGRAVPRGWAM